MAAASGAVVTRRSARGKTAEETGHVAEIGETWRAPPSPRRRRATWKTLAAEQRLHAGRARLAMLRHRARPTCARDAMAKRTLRVVVRLARETSGGRRRRRASRRRICLGRRGIGGIRALGRRLRWVLLRGILLRVRVLRLVLLPAAGHEDDSQRPRRKHRDHRKSHRALLTLLTQPEQYPGMEYAVGQAPTDGVAPARLPPKPPDVPPVHVSEVS